MKYPYYLLSFLFLQLIGLARPINSPAQEINNDFFKKNLSQQSYTIDPEAEAVVLYEKSTTHLLASDMANSVFTFTVHKIVKVLKTPTTRDKNISITILPRDQMDSAVTAAIYTLDNGKVKRKNVSQEALTKIPADRYYMIFFPMTDVKIGDIIEYTFKITLTASNALQQWSIQEEYPKLRSEFEVIAPKRFNYRVFTQGDISFKEYEDDTESTNLTGSYYLPKTKLAAGKFSVLWGTTNVLPFVMEPFVADEKDHVQSMNIILAGKKQEDNEGHKLTEWEVLDRSLDEFVFFGKKTVDPNRFLKKEADAILETKKTDLEKAKGIFNYVRTNFECNNFNDPYSPTPFKKLYENKRGTVGDINLMLTAMLRYAGFAAFPVILAKVGTNSLNDKFPISGDLNYVVCRVTINNTNYYLDATNKYNAFGVLPAYCYHGYAMLVSEKGEGVYLNRDDMNAKEEYHVAISGIDADSLLADVTERISLRTSVLMRKNWNKDPKMVENYVKEQARLFSDKAVVAEMSVDGMENADTTILLRYRFKFKNNHDDICYFNTDYSRFFTENPFTAMKRTLPVEFPYKMYKDYSMEIRLPDGYIVEDIPAPVNITCSDGMAFTHTVAYDKGDHLLTVKSDFAAGKTTYSRLEYDNIRALFTKMVLTQGTQVVVKKKK